MAGIGFDLKKLFVGAGAIRKVRAYAYAGIVCSGTMLLAVVLLLGVQMLARRFEATESGVSTLVALMVYALMGSLLFSSVWQILLSRFVADQLYEGRPERVMPSLLGASVLLMVPGGILYGFLLSSARSVSPLDRFLNWAFFMELLVVWLQMTYITAVRNYRQILRIFFLGVVMTLMLGWLLLSAGVSVLTALLSAMVCGYGVMLIGFMVTLFRRFPRAEGSVFTFLSWIRKAPQLVWIGFFSMAGAFVHLLVMWFGPQGESIMGLFRFSPAHDTAAFFAFLVTVPANINFVVSVEVNFYQHYRRYFAAVTGSGTLAELALAREGMITSLQQEVFKLTQLQLFFMVAYSLLMRYVLEATGFTRPMIGTFQVMCVGYSAYAVGNSLMLTQLYFDDRKGALATCLVFFGLNLGITLYTMNSSGAYDGMGLAVAGVAMHLTGLFRLMRYVRNIDFHVYCGQPVLSQHHSEGKANLIQRFAWRAGAERQANPEEKKGEGI